MPKQVTHGRYGITTFVYDGGSGRAKKVSPSGAATYYVGEHFEVKNGEQTKYIFAGNLRIAKVSSTTGTFYFHKDHLGSSSAMTNSSGVVQETTNYMPFGEQREHTGSNISNYKFTDQELDPETGLYYYGARYYDPVIGRFISPDSIVQASFDPQTLNRYSYCRNNPLIYTDPSGNYVEWVSGIIASAIGSHIAACSTAYNGGDPEAVMKAANIGGGIGFISGYTGGAIGVGLGGSFWAYVAGGAVGGAVGGTLNAAVYGGNIWEGAMYGAIGGAIGGGIGASGLGNDVLGVTVKIAAAGVVGGTIAELSGGKFSQGALPAMFGAAVSIGYEMVKNSNADKGTSNSPTANRTSSRYSLDVDLTLKIDNSGTIDNMFADASNEWTADMIKALKFSACGVKEIKIFTFKAVAWHAVLNVGSLGIEALGLGITTEAIYTGTKVSVMGAHTFDGAKDAAKDIGMRIDNCKKKYDIK